MRNEINKTQNKHLSIRTYEINLASLIYITNIHTSRGIPKAIIFS